MHTMTQNNKPINKCSTNWKTHDWWCHRFVQGRRVPQPPGGRFGRAAPHRRSSSWHSRCHQLCLYSENSMQIKSFKIFSISRIIVVKIVNVFLTAFESDFVILVGVGVWTSGRSRDFVEPDLGGLGGGTAVSTTSGCGEIELGQINYLL